MAATFPGYRSSKDRSSRILPVYAAISPINAYLPRFLLFHPCRALWMDRVPNYEIERRHLILVSVLRLCTEVYSAGKLIIISIFRASLYL